MNTDDKLDVYILDDDQPTTCPKCGARTYFTEVGKASAQVQHHKCLNEQCGYVFNGVFEDSK